MGHARLCQPQFEALLGGLARIERQLTLPGGHRTLYLWRTS